MEAETRQGMQEMEELLYKLLWSHLQSLGLFRKKHAVLTDMREQAGISISYARWLQESFNLLEQKQYLHCDGHATCTVLDPTLIESATLWQRWDECKEHWLQNADLKAQVVLVETMLYALPTILTGRRLATEVMFPNGSMQLVEGFYQHNAIADYFNDILAQLLVTYLQERLIHERNARIRLLEIGAGTGGTTNRVLQMLQPYRASIEEYCYSDISNAFLHYGERMYGAEHPYLTYQFFNVEKPLAEQGIEAGSYDVVIAANVLHATSDIRRTVRNAKAALKKHGLLLLNEITGTSIFTHLTFGLLSGWWAYEDPELRVPGCPALTTENWQVVLSDEGFGAICIPTRDMQEVAQQIIVAESDGIVRQQYVQPDIRRDSALRLSTPSPQTPFPHNNGEITDQMIRDHVQSILLESITEVLKIDERNIEDDISFSEYGVDSIVAVNLINVINQKSHLNLQTTVLFDNNNIEQLVQHILREEMTTLKALLQDGIFVVAGSAQGTVPTAPIRETGADADRADRNVPVTSLRTGVVGMRTGASPVPTDGATQTTNQHVILERASGIDDLTTHHEPIAIIGMSGRFARSKTVSELWEHLANGTDLVEEVSRWDLAELSPASVEKKEPYCKHGSFLEEIDLFDPLFFNISRHEAAYMDPQQRLVLEEAWKALEDAGYVGSSIEGKQCGVYMGCIAGDYPHLFDDVPPAQAFWGNASSVIPARIAYYLNLQGPAIAIDTACSSSLVAMHLACQSLWNGETELALAGGVFLQCTPQFYQSANRAGMLSLTGHCSTFDDRADGFVPGEGVGIVVLKRLKDAEASGDHIYGVIRGSGINQDGATRGITVPSANSQERLLRSVYETFQIEPSQIQMVEAHGTGTKLGDPIEYEALTRVFHKYTDKKEYCALGSIKTNLGHTATAAGVAGVIKILLSLQHKQIPPSLHFQSGNAHIQFEESPFYVNTNLQDWRPAAQGTQATEAGGTRRCAAISSFGFSGTNAHMVIEGAPECSRRHAEMPSYLIVLSARTSDQLRQQVEQLVTFCECTAEVDCGNMSYTLLLGRKHLKHRLACVVHSHKELEALLTKWLEKGKVPQISVSNLENWEQRENPSLRRYGNQCIEDCQRWAEAVGTGLAPVPTAPIRMPQVPVRAPMLETYLEQLSTVADLYLQGYSLAFEQLFADNGYSRISLPTYPFARERCWADEIVTQPNRRDSALRLSDTYGIGGKELTPFLHPLVQRNTSTLWEQQFKSTFRGDEFFLADHVISGQRILPGVAYLEMARAAVREATGADTSHEPIPLRLSHVMWVRPLIMSKYPITVHITLEPQESGTIAFLISRNVAEQKEPRKETGGKGTNPLPPPTAPREEEVTGREQAPSLLCQGTIELRTESAIGLMASQGLDLPTIQARCQHQISATECYQRYRELGISHGPAYQGIEHLSVGEDEALARLRLPVALGAQTHTDFVLHPSMLDAALQACIGLLVKRPELQKPHLPFALEELSIVGEVPAVGWAWIRQRQSSVTGLVGKGLAPLLDIDVCDDAGRVALFLRGLSIRPLLAEEETRTLLLTPNWKEDTPLPAIETRRSTDASLGSVVLRIPLPTCTCPLILLCDLPSIEASRIQARLSEDEHCRGLKVIPWHSSQSRRELRFQDAVVQLIQELQHLLQSQPTGLMLVQVVVAHREKPSFLEALAGVLKTAQQEYPQLRGQLIEVEAEPKEEELLAWLHENQLRPQESHTRYLDDKRWVMQWQEYPEVTLPPKIPWKENGCYLISGGAGGMARLFVQEIAQQVETATVILVGRSVLSAVGVVPCADPVPCATGVRDSSSGIHIDYQQVDVSDGPAVHALIQSVLTQYGHLDGIIHAAGVLRDSLLLNKTQEELESVLAPKVIGVEHLDEASEQIPLDFFILCSSLSAVMGNVGQADYAGANAYLDAFAHARQTLVTAGQRQGATVSINWPLWEAGGIQIETSERQTMQKRLGVEAMGTETGMKMLYQALASGLVQVVVAHGQIERIKQLLQHSSPNPSVGVGQAQDAGQAQGTAPTAPDSEAWQDKLREALSHMLSRMFKVRAEEINTEKEFSEYGFDSVAFTQFANRLNQTYQLNLTPPLFFQYSTIERLAQYMQVTYASVLAPYFAAASPVTPRVARKDFTQELVTTEEASSTSLFTRSHFRNYYSLIQFPEKKTPAADSSIAIIGMSGMFPQAPDVQSFWSNLLEGRDCISEIPRERWDWQTYFGSPTTEADKTNVKWAGILDGIELFDPQFFGISPREAEQMDPQQRLLMMYVWKAIEDAGYAASSLSGTNTALFVGTASSGYSELLSRARVPIEGYSSTSQTPSVGPGRMSYFLNLHGPSEPIETACSSSLVAIHRGVNAIESGQCAMAIVGGVNTLVSPDLHISFSKAGMLSEDGRCKPFSAQANGYGRGEGVGMLVLKKLSDAEQAGDHIYGVIRASAENHSGRASSLTAPNPRAQADLLITAYRKAGIDPRTVGYIEAHGTGTALGDPIEINGLKTAWSLLAEMIGEGPMPRATCGIGSVKSNIGHLELAAGIAGVIKVLLQLQHKKLVKSLHGEQLNPYIELEASPFYIVQENREWETLRDHTGKALPRRAGVSSFGFGGANAHVVLEEYVPKATSDRKGRDGVNPSRPLRSPAPPLLIVLSAKNEERLQEQVQQLLAWMQSGTYAEEVLQDLAYTLQVGREAMEERLALQVSSLIELKEKLRRYLQEPQEAGDWYRGQVRRHDTINVFAADEDGQKAVAAWMEKGKYGKLLDLWVKGLKVDWQYLYTAGTGSAQGTGQGLVGARLALALSAPTAPSLPRRISLPTYPFAHERYWIPTEGTGSEPRTRQRLVGARLAPTLSVPTDNASALSAQILEKELARSLAKTLHLEQSDIDIEVPYIEMGLDSVIGVEWVQSLNKEYASNLPASCIYDYPTIRQLARFLEKELLKQEGHLQTVGTGLAPVRSPTASREKEVIAIVGMSGKYPNANNLTEYWDNLVQGKNAIREIPLSRFNVSDYYDPNPEASGKISCKWLGALDEIEYFDPFFFRISPAEAMGMDPQQRIFLEEGYKAFEDAGYSPKLLSNRKCGVYLGIVSHEYALLLREQKASQMNILGISPAIAAARIAYLLNLKGPAIAIDTTCSSSLVATHLACQALLNQEIDMALVGGVNLCLTPDFYIGMCAAGMLSPNGQCKTFDASADGFVPGEGVGALVLKRLADAEADHDQIYGLIIGSGMNQDGASNGITAPSAKSQIELMRDIYQKYQIDPKSISYVEMHGTGTKLGDPIELQALATVFCEKTQRKQYCAIGSVKSNIGHTLTAAGVAGVQKVLLAMKQKMLVPTLHFEQPNEHFNFEASPFYVNTKVQDWNTAAEGKPLRAAVSSFGFSGTNAHLVIEEYILAREANGSRRDGACLRPTETPILFVLSAKNEQQLKSYAQDMKHWIQTHPEQALMDLVFTLQVGREAMEYRLAIEASSREVLLQRLEGFVDNQASTGVHTGQVGKDTSDAVLSEDDEDGQSLLRIWYQNKNLEKIAQIWVRGANVDWMLLYTVGTGSAQGTTIGASPMATAPTLPHRISLPTYPFARKRYWIPTVAAGQAQDTVPTIPALTSSGTSPSPTVTVHPRSSGESPLSIAQQILQPEAGASPGQAQGTQTTTADKPNGNGKAATVEAGPIVTNRVALRPLVDRPMLLGNGAGQSQPSISLSLSDQSFSQSSSNDVVAPVRMPEEPRTQVTASCSTLQAPQLETELVRGLAKALYMEEGDIDVEKPLGVIGLDSIISAEWIQSLNKEYACNLKASCVYDYPTIRQLAGFLEKELLKHGAGIQQTPVQDYPSERKLVSTLSLDDVLQQVQQGTLDIETADQVLHQHYLSIGLAPDGYARATKEGQ